LAELCHVPLPDRILDGKSLVPVLQSADAQSPHRVFHWQTGGGNNPSWAVREGPWKLLGNPRDTASKAPLSKEDRLFLVNLDDDLGETANAVSQHSEIVERLRKLHEVWVAEVEAQ